jgi:hypothetical protein
MPIIQSSLPQHQRLILLIRLIVGGTWFLTTIRRILVPNFQERITAMAQGSTLIPEQLMDLAVENWFIIFSIVLSLELISSVSLLTGTLARLGSLLLTVNGFAIGMAGIGISLFDLFLPWSVAILSLVLLLFTHPGQYKGFDGVLINKNIPDWLKKFM